MSCHFARNCCGKKFLIYYVLPFTWLFIITGCLATVLLSDDAKSSIKTVSVSRM